jgi:signal transduction histidine kinase/ActR/RegA family two-component response regulator
MTRMEGISDSLLNSAVQDWMQRLAPQGIFLTDKSLTIVAWNGWLEERSGRQAKDVLGRNLFELYPDLIERGLHTNYGDALEGQVRILSQRLHGYLLPMPSPEFKEYAEMQQSVRISPLSCNGQVTGTLTIIDDVTERVLRESQLQLQLESRSKLLASEKAARREAEAANRLKDEFLATVSHELRTPLTAIVGWTTLLRTGELDSEKTNRAIETIYRNAHSQVQLISDLLDISRVISNKLSLTISTVNIPMAIEAAVDGVRLEAESKEIQLHSRYEPKFSLITGDAERLQQIIWNLLSNAIKFTPRGGTVQVDLKRVDDYAEITVTDSGIGIEPEFLPFVFDRFRQANSATTRHHRGLGLGLSIVRELTELHHGTVSATSDGIGKGATFHVRLPIAGSAEALRTGKAVNSRTILENLAMVVSPDVLKGKKVLVVDDEPDTRDLIRTVLEKTGANVMTSYSVPDAIGIFERHRPDCVISDIGMPGEDGYSFIRKVRALPRNKGGETPAAALTAYARDEDRIRILHSGFQAYILKPVEPGELVVAVAGIVGKA